MLTQLNSIEELTGRLNYYVNCYVSTGAGELEDIFMQMGFQDGIDAVDRKTLWDDYLCVENNLYYGSVIWHGLEVDFVDIPLEEALSKRRDIDFMPMSKFRVYTNRSPNADKILLSVMKALDNERQNMAFINDAGSTAYVKLSEFYR
ncbi:hypothetical protein HYS31_03870 [Candidatus Woesearchaeota archaeon]|nr:hypothetical protein [Candidatus Woesearchaeota archaeon]